MSMEAVDFLHRILSLTGATGKESGRTNMYASKTDPPYPTKNFSLRYVIMFLAIFTLASLTWSGARGTSLQRFVVEEATVGTSSRIISLINPGQEVRSEGARLISPHVRLSVLNGCEGTESVILLVAAILAYPAPLRRKPAGLLFGAAGIFVLNQLRLVGLFYILRYQPEWFSAMHGYISPVLILITGSLIFVLWVNWAGQEKKHALGA